jgi:hypothetical protein
MIIIIILVLLGVVLDSFFAVVVITICPFLAVHWSVTMGVAGGIVAHMFQLIPFRCKNDTPFVVVLISMLCRSFIHKGFLRDIKQQCFLIF